MDKTSPDAVGMKLGLKMLLGDEKMREFESHMIAQLQETDEFHESVKQYLSRLATRIHAKVSDDGERIRIDLYTEEDHESVHEIPLSDIVDNYDPFEQNGAAISAALRRAADAIDRLSDEYRQHREDYHNTHSSDPSPAD